MKFRNFNVPDSEFSGSGAARRASRVIDKAGGGAYLSRALSRGAKKDAIAVIFRAFVVAIA